MKTRKDVIKRASKKLKITQQSLIKITNVLDEVIKEIVVDEKEELKLANLVEIKPVYKESKRARNPKTNEYVMSKPKYTVKSKIIGTWFKN